MRILLLSMPDSFEHTPAIAVRMPNRALGSISGNVDAHHQDTTWRSALGLEPAETVFERYRALRAREREYLDWPDPLAGESMSPATATCATPLELPCHQALPDAS